MDSVRVLPHAPELGLVERQVVRLTEELAPHVFALAAEENWLSARVYALETAASARGERAEVSAPSR